jgi:hypothetical protein
MKKAEGFFEITSVCKDDLRETFKGNKEALKRIDKMTKADMKYLASKMADAYVEDCFWEDLKIIFESRFL